MNTGTQRIGATPKGAWTTTTPTGKLIPGKLQNRKDMTAIVAAHNIPYVAQAAPHAWRDLMTKVKKAISKNGPSFINVLSPCPRGWRYDTKNINKVSKLAVNCCIWPLYEVDEGTWRLNYRPNPKIPITEWFQSQGRFSHLLLPENKDMVEMLQQQVDRDWNKLEKLCDLK